MIYIDKPEWSKHGGKSRKKYSHMIADSLTELHDFAAKIKVKRHFFHASSRIKHYDIAEEMFQVVLDNGAMEVDTREIVKIGKWMK